VRFANFDELKLLLNPGEILPTLHRNSMLDTIEFLKTVKLFSLLDEKEMNALAASFKTTSYETGQAVFSEGDAGDSLYVVLSGKLELSTRDYTGDKILLAEVGPTELFGETSLFDLGPRSATAVALEKATLLELHRDDLVSFLKSNPSAALDLLAIMARRLRETDQLLQGRVSRNLNEELEHHISPIQRLATWIADFSGSMAFLLLNAGIFVGWIVYNLEMLPGANAFDPYPFGFLTMSVSLEAIFLSIIVLLSQNLQASRERRRNEIEYEVNLKAELEIAQLHERVSKLHTDLSQRLGALEGKTRN
jgi:CRP/FNR family cyclic AMP-dependent transcriptional regulator